MNRRQREDHLWRKGSYVCEMLVCSQGSSVSDRSVFAKVLPAWKFLSVFRFSRLYSVGCVVLRGRKNYFTKSCCREELDILVVFRKNLAL